MIRRGDIREVDLEPVRGSEADKRRPAIIVSNDAANASATWLGRGVVTVVPVTLATADRFGRVATALKQAGRPIPTNDIWIAAQAMETGAELISFDRHYEWVDGLAWRARRVASDRLEVHAVARPLGGAHPPNTRAGPTRGDPGFPTARGLM